MAVVHSVLRNGVMTITLADEERRNALSAQLTSELVAALDIADNEPDVRVVVVTNSGTVFCAGANLAERSSTDGASGNIDPRTLFGRAHRSTTQSEQQRYILSEEDVRGLDDRKQFLPLAGRVVR